MEKHPAPSLPGHCMPVVQSRDPKNKGHHPSALRNMTTPINFQLISLQIIIFLICSVNFLLGLQLSLNGPGHFLLVNLIWCLMRTGILRMALPSEIISAESYRSSHFIRAYLPRIFWRRWRWSGNSPHPGSIPQQLSPRCRKGKKGQR